MPFLYPKPSRDFPYLRTKTKVLQSPTGLMWFKCSKPLSYLLFCYCLTFAHCALCCPIGPLAVLWIHQAWLHLMSSVLTVPPAWKALFTDIMASFLNFFKCLLEIPVWARRWRNKETNTFIFPFISLLCGLSLKFKVVHKSMSQTEFSIHFTCVHLAYVTKKKIYNVQWCKQEWVWFERGYRVKFVCSCNWKEYIKSVWNWTHETPRTIRQ